MCQPSGHYPRSHSFRFTSHQPRATTHPSSPPTQQHPPPAAQNRLPPVLRQHRRSSYDKPDSDANP